jgi:prophage antirepressor-like protein
MDTLINLNKSTDHITIDLNDKKHQIKIVGTYDDPYFCGKDVCAVLEYSNMKDALQKHVKSNNKKSLSFFSNELDSAIHPNSLGQNNLKNLDYHTGKAVYISEGGLYQLIMHSKTKFAQAFQDLVCDTILPSIRKHGQFVLEESFAKQLALKDTIIQSQEKLIQQKEDINQRIQHYIDNTKPFPKNSLIYIVTTLDQAKKNYFKIGHIKEATRKALTNRLGTYNTGQSSDFYYCYVKKIYRADLLDYKMKKVLEYAKHNKRREVVMMNFNSLVKLIDLMAENNDCDFEEINRHIAQLKDEAEIIPIIPVSVDFNTLDLEDPDVIEIKTPLAITDSTVITINGQIFTQDAMRDILVDIINLYLQTSGNSPTYNYYTNNLLSHKITLEWGVIKRHIMDRINLTNINKLKAKSWWDEIKKLHTPTCLKIKHH